MQAADLSGLYHLETVRVEPAGGMPEKPTPAPNVRSCEVFVLRAVSSVQDLTHSADQGVR